MIPAAYITEWRNTAPWQTLEQIEQDLIICRILVELYRDPMLKNVLLFRGGTALHKLYFDKPVRYSEDLDLVQIAAGPIKPIVDAIQQILKPWLGSSSTKTRKDGFRILYTFIPESDPEGKRRIKIEINTREHFTVYPINTPSYSVNSRWYSGDCTISTYDINELAATKLRALYQRKKGRDLFDLYWTYKQGLIIIDKIVHAFQEYCSKQGVKIKKDDFKHNLEQKLHDDIFLHDIEVLLLPEIEYNPQIAGQYILDEIVAALPE
jgi:predicted nucleotidyltransferase component of viral defense system